MRDHTWLKSISLFCIFFLRSALIQTHRSGLSLLSGHSMRSCTIGHACRKFVKTTRLKIGSAACPKAKNRKAIASIKKKGEGGWEAKNNYGTTLLVSWISLVTRRQETKTKPANAKQRLMKKGVSRLRRQQVIKYWDEATSLYHGTKTTVKWNDDLNAWGKNTQALQWSQTTSMHETNLGKQ